MDNKARGLSVDILSQALTQAKAGRAHILGKMLEAIEIPREQLSEFAPRILTIKIPTDKIREVIGSGGKVVRGIQEETGAQIDIQEDGTIYIASRDLGGEEALKRIQNIVKEPEIGEVYEGRVVSIQPFGAFVELVPGKDGLLHISRVAQGRVEKVEDVLNVGDEVKVQIMDIDERGKVSLDRLDKPPAPPRAEGSGEGSGSGGGGGDRGPRREGGGGGEIAVRAGATSSRAAPAAGNLTRGSRETGGPDALPLRPRAADVRSVRAAAQTAGHIGERRGKAGRVQHSCKRGPTSDPTARLPTHASPASPQTDGPDALRRCAPGTTAPAPSARTATGSCATSGSTTTGTPAR